MTTFIKDLPTPRSFVPPESPGPLKPERQLAAETLIQGLKIALAVEDRAKTPEQSVISQFSPTPAIEFVAQHTEKPRLVTVTTFPTESTPEGVMLEATAYRLDQLQELIKQHRPVAAAIEPNASVIKGLVPNDASRVKDMLKKALPNTQEAAQAAGKHDLQS